MKLRALLVLALIGAGCGSKAASESGTAGTAAPGKQLTARDKAVTFAQCMRDNGVGEFPDPKGSGGLTLDGVVNGSSLDPESAAWKGAIAACKKLQPPGFTGGGKRTPKQRSASLAFADCIRANGVPDFPDPVDGQPLVDTRRIPSTDTEGGMTILNAAMRKCGKQGEAAGARP